MRKIIYTDPFLDQMTQVTSNRVRGAIFDAIDKLIVVPVIGSTNLPQAIIDKYGDEVRKLVVKPFLVIYKVLPDENLLILGLMYGRAAY
ncbi:MAG: hypothetical protein IJ113_09170 [Eggerthellaceae bacterium]|nr:hypothetical protein [Eggerthellaceae bacterium]